MVSDEPSAQTDSVADLGSGRRGDETARLLVDLMSATGVDAAVLFGVMDDGSLAVLGQHGYQPDTVSSWRRIPLTVDVPLTRAVNEGVPVFVGSPEDLGAQFPTLKQRHSVHQALAAVPVWDGDTRIGSMGLSWIDEQVFDDAQRQRVLAIARRAGSVIMRNLRADDPDHDYLANVLHLLRDPWLVMVPTDDMQVTSLAIESVSPAVRGGDELVGERLLVAFPGVAADSRLLDELQRLLLYGGRFVRGTQSAGMTTAPWDQRAGRLRAVRTGRRVALTWHALDRS
jgi:hypothetical protein